MDQKLVMLLAATLFGGIASADDYAEGKCPVIGNVKSKIYHVPGSSHYAAMLKQNKSGDDNRKCFPDEDAAKKQGFRPSKS